MLLTLHIATGAAAMVLGAIALSARKGGWLHRKAGIFFVGSMVAMGLSATALELLKHRQPANMIAALLTLYFVFTGAAAVRPPSRWTPRINLCALVLSTALAGLAVIGGYQLINKPGLSTGGVPFRTIGTMSFVLATALTLAAIGDIRLVRVRVLSGSARLHRHLWRMCFALFIAAGSFFSIKERVARVLPAPFADGWFRALPILVLFGVTFFWMWKVRRSRAASHPNPHALVEVKTKGAAQ